MLRPRLRVCPSRADVSIAPRDTHADDAERPSRRLRRRDRESSTRPAAFADGIAGERKARPHDDLPAGGLLSVAPVVTCIDH